LPHAPTVTASPAEPGAWNDTRLEWSWALAAGLAGLAVLFVLDRSMFRDLSTPFLYRGDGISHLLVIKSLGDNLWYLDNPFLGAPFGQEFYDYPIPELALLAILKLLVRLTGDAAMAFNLFYLAGFALVPAVSFAVLRRIGVIAPFAFAGAVAYAFVPYHFFRLGHLLLAMYAIVPVLVLVALRMFDGQPFGGPDASEPLRRPRVREFALLVLCGLCGAYYAAFGCLMFATAGIAVAVRRKAWRPLANAALVIAIVMGATAVASLPTVAYRLKHGTNPEVAQRSPVHMDLFGLRITQLLMPPEGHPLAPFAQASSRYNTTTPLVTENKFASLGLLMSAGFLLLLAIATLGTVHRFDSMLGRLATLNMAILVVATIGGLASIVAYFGISQIRAWNRVSIVIAFLALAGLLLAAQRWFPPGGRTSLAWALAAITGALAIYDQTAWWPKRDATIHGAYWNDRMFVKTLEAKSSCRLIYELPYEEWPEPGPRPGYGNGRPYLHSSEVRWSYGAMKGRDADAWHRTLSIMSPAKQLERIREAGFCGVVVNSGTYSDMARELDPLLRSQASGPPVPSPDNAWIFYPLSPTGSKPVPAASLVADNLSLAFDDPRVHTITGAKIPKLGLVSRGNAGVLAYGPYAPLTKGRYSVRLYGMAEAGARGTLDAVADGGGLMLGKADFAVPAAKTTDGELATLQFDNPVNVTNLEIRVHASAGPALTVTRYEVESIPSK
jgi:phosphoglycerol transferase